MRYEMSDDIRVTRLAAMINEKRLAACIEQLDDDIHDYVM